MKRIAAFATHGVVLIILIFAFVRSEALDTELETAGVTARKKPAAKKAAPAAKKVEPQPPPAPARDKVAPLPDPDRQIALLNRLVAAYPDFLTAHDGASIIWRNGERMQFDDGKTKTYGERLELPDIEDSFFDAYPTGRQNDNPEQNVDPGRSLHEPFFARMYGDCKAGDVEGRLVEIVWLPKNSGRRIQVTTVNGVDRRLQMISNELDALPPEILKYLTPLDDVYSCKPIAGTARISMHGYGAAIDINPAFADDWQDRRPVQGKFRYRNRVPWEIVEIFEKHGFIWGGKWSRFETSHFEYRPELLSDFNPALPVASTSVSRPVASREPRIVADQPALLPPAAAPADVDLLPLPTRQPRNIR